MSIAINEDHVALAGTVSDFLVKHGSLAAARALLDGAQEELPTFWADLAAALPDWRESATWLRANEGRLTRYKPRLR